MKIRPTICRIILCAGALMYCCAGGEAQEAGQGNLLTLSAQVHEARYPEVICEGCILPHWDRGYLFHLELERDPAVATMYDKSGKKLLEARMTPPDAVQGALIAAGAARGGGMVAAGGGIMSDGVNTRFITKSDSAGRIVAAVRTEGYYPREVCEETDGTVWVLGFESDGMREIPNGNVLRHYSFEKGLLGSFVSLNSIHTGGNGAVRLSRIGQRFLSCSKDRVSILLPLAGQFIQVDTATDKVWRWDVELPVIARGKTRGLAVTEDGRVLVGISQCCDGTEKRITRGLYELKTNRGAMKATLLPIGGTVSSYGSNEDMPEGTFLELWGADGNELVVQLQGDNYFDLSWVRVSDLVKSSN